MASSLGTVLRQARDVRSLSRTDAARAAGISAAYLSKLEGDAVKRPSPNVLHDLGVALALPYDALMRLSGYPVPDGSSAEPAATIGGALFADLAEHEREELLAYLAWYRARRRARTEAPGAG